MAKLKAPLFSLGATQQIGKALVYFGWKGLDLVREYVVPANPQTGPQTTQRGYMTAAVSAIHAAQAHATLTLVAADVTAYALWASVVKAATTWFNQAVKNWVDQNVAGRTGAIYGAGSTTPGAGSLAVAIHSNKITAGGITAGNFLYGPSKTALINTQAATLPGGAFRASATLAGLTAGIKYYWQFRPTALASYVGANCGIYYGTPT